MHPIFYLLKGDYNSKEEGNYMKLLDRIFRDVKRRVTESSAVAAVQRDSRTQQWQEQKKTMNTNLRTYAKACHLSRYPQLLGGSWAANPKP